MIMCGTMIQQDLWLFRQHHGDSLVKTVCVSPSWIAKQKTRFTDVGASSGLSRIKQESYDNCAMCYMFFNIKGNIF